MKKRKNELNKEGMLAGNDCRMETVSAGREKLEEQTWRLGQTW
jgi:hypothetical protein